MLNKAKVRVYICPKKIILVHVIGHRQPKIVVQDCFDNNHDFLISVDVIKNWLLEKQLSVPVEVIFSSHYCRFLVLPWNEKIIEEKTRLNLAHALFQRYYAPEISQDYEFSLGSMSFLQPQLVSAISKLWLSPLVEAIAKTPCRLVSIQPSVAIVWNRFYSTIHTEWLLMIEQDRQIYLQQQHGYIQQIEIRPYQVGQIINAEKSLSLFGDIDTQNQENQPVLKLLIDVECEYNRYALCGVF